MTSDKNKFNYNSPSYFPKSYPPSTINLRLQFQHMDFRGRNVHSPQQSTWHPLDSSWLQSTSSAQGLISLQNLKPEKDNL